MKDTSNTMEKASQKLIFTFLGLPASGKGTQAKILAADKNMRVVSAGDLIREIMASSSDDPFVLAIKKRYDAGIPQPDEVVVDLFSKFLDESQSSVVLDNFPFSTGLADFLNTYIKNHPIWHGPIIVFISLDPEQAVKRAISRKICSGCGAIYGMTDEMICEKCGGSLLVRADDNEETMRTRISHYYPRLKDLVEYYKANNGALLEINGSKSVPEVTAEINQKIDEYLKR